MEDGWTIPDNASSWRLEVPGAGLCAVTLITEKTDTRLDVQLVANDGAYYDVQLTVPVDDAGSAQGDQFLESLSVV